MPSHKSLGAESCRFVVDWILGPTLAVDFDTKQLQVSAGVPRKTTGDWFQNTRPNSKNEPNRMKPLANPYKHTEPPLIVSNESLSHFKNKSIPCSFLKEPFSLWRTGK